MIVKNKINKFYISNFNATKLKILNYQELLIFISFLVSPAGDIVSPEELGPVPARGCQTQAAGLYQSGEVTPRRLDKEGGA